MQSFQEKNNCWANLNFADILIKEAFAKNSKGFFMFGRKVHFNTNA